MAPPALIVGCGYLGKRVADRWIGQGRRVVALTRGDGAELAAAGIEPRRGDVTDPATLRHLPPATTVLYAVGLDRRAGHSMRTVYVEGLANVLAALPGCERFIHVSSTGVYGQTDGSWVDESSLTEPVEASGQVVLEAERTLRAIRPDAVILRFAGIYGPNRILRKEALLRGDPLVGDADKWLNLIHVQDGVEAVLAAEARATPGSTYLIADDTPVQRRDFYTFWAKKLGGPPARFESGTATAEPNRRASNRSAKAALGFEPQFPSYIEGSAAT